MSGSTKTQKLIQKTHITDGVSVFHVLVMIGLLFGAIWFTFVTYIASSTMFQTMPIAVMLWIGFALYFGITEVLPQAMHKFD